MERGRHDRASAGCRFPARTDEAGSSLLDAVIGTLVILVVLIPTANLLSSGNVAAQQNAQRLAAEGIASGWLDQEQAEAASSTTGPGTTCTTGSYTQDGWIDVACAGSPARSGRRWPPRP